MDKVGRCRLTLSNPVLKAPTASAIETTYDELLPNVTFTFNLRCYDKGFPMHADGQPWEQAPCVLDVRLRNRATMLTVAAPAEPEPVGWWADGWEAFYDDDDDDDDAELCCTPHTCMP